jgi:hypothetical protein
MGHFCAEFRRRGDGCQGTSHCLGCFGCKLNVIYVVGPECEMYIMLMKLKLMLYTPWQMDYVDNLFGYLSPYSDSLYVKE